MFVPESDAQLIHAAIPGAKPDGNGGYTVPCLTSASVGLIFGGTTFAIDPRDILMEPSQDGINCVSAIIANPIFLGNLWLVRLSHVYFRDLFIDWE